MSESTLFKTALSKAMAQCSRREFCIRDIREKLESWGVGITDNERIIGLLIKENFINEERFANAFVKDKFNYNKWGKVKIAAHLRVKNIQGDVISAALESIDNKLYIKSIKELIDNHRRFVKAKNQYDLKARLLRYGLSKGFESHLLYDILNDQLNDLED
jgi:regulatory protein